MVPNDPESPPSDHAHAAPEPNYSRAAPTDGKPALGGASRLLLLSAAAGLIAGTASLIAGELVLRRYQTDLLAPLTISPSPQDMRRWHDARLYSATLTFATMGGFLGLAMGLAGGRARGSLAAGATAATVGFVLGTAAPGSISLVLLSLFFKRYDPQSGDLVFPLLTHGAIWSTVGAVGGLAFGLGLGGRGRWKSTLAGGIGGAAAATVVYEIAGAVAFATSKTDLPLSTWITTRGMAQLLVAILSAVGAALALRQSGDDQFQ
jgi:hypothetical protein